MNLHQLKQEFEPLPHGERIAFLTTRGYDLQEANDIINWLYSNPTPPPQKKAAEDRLSETLQKLEARIELAKTNPPDPKQEELSLFELDIVHTRHLLGGATLHDDASYHKPGLILTESVKWLRDEFRPSCLPFALILGGTGSGKTFAALAHLNSIATVDIRFGVLQRSNARYVHAYKLAEMVHSLKKHADALDDLARCGVLLIDDLGAEPVGFRGADFIAHLDYLVGERHKFRKRTIITSNTTGEAFKSLYGERIVSRFNQIGLVLETNEPDLRQR